MPRNQLTEDLNWIVFAPDQSLDRAKDGFGISVRCGKKLCDALHKGRGRGAKKLVYSIKIKKRPDFLDRFGGLDAAGIYGVKDQQDVFFHFLPIELGRLGADRCRNR